MSDYYTPDEGYHEDTIDDDIASMKTYIAAGEWWLAQDYLHAIILRSETRDAILDLAEEMAEEAETVEPKKGTDWERLKAIAGGDY